MEYNAEEKAFFDSHVWAVLATGRRDGSPQQGVVDYTLDEVGQLLISTRTPTARWHNMRRNPAGEPHRARWPRQPPALRDRRAHHG